MSISRLCPIDSITGIWKFDKLSFSRNRGRSTPGHLIHFVDRGDYRLTTDGRHYDIAQNDVIYYFETEDVLWEGGDSDVTFYSIGFSAPGLEPPDIQSRVFPGRAGLRDYFLQAYNLWKGERGTAATFELYSVLMLILAHLFQTTGNHQHSVHSLKGGDVWWAIEYEVKKRRAFRASLPELCDVSGYSRATVIRACRSATGETPIQRLRVLRLEEAKGLLSFSMLSITEVAMMLGYSRLHEFSREFSRFMGIPPNEYRRTVV